MHPTNPDRLGTIRILMLLCYKPFLSDLKEALFVDRSAFQSKWKVQAFTVSKRGKSRGRNKKIYSEVIGENVEDVEAESQVMLVDLKFGVTSVFGGGDAPDGYKLIAIPLVGSKTEVLKAIKNELTKMKPLTAIVKGKQDEIEEKLLMVRYCLGPDPELAPEGLAKELISTTSLKKSEIEKSKASVIRNALKTYEKHIILP